MKIDSVLPGTGPVDQRSAARAAAAAGYDGIWGSEVRHDPFVTLALAATAARGIDIGSSIVVAFARNPMTTAAAAHDLQALSGGRFMLGLGSQVRAHVTRRFSMPWTRPAARMREYVMAMRAIWASWQDGTALRFQGDFYSHTLMTPLFVPQPHGFSSPRVFVAGVGRLMTEAAGAVADGFLSHGFTTVRYLDEITLPALRRGRGGRLDDFEIVGTPMIVTGRTEEEYAANDRKIRELIAFYGSTPAYRPVLELHGWGELGDDLHRLSLDQRWDEMGGLVDDDVCNAFAVAGTPAEVGAEIVRRFGGMLHRCTVYPSYDAGPEVLDEIRDAIRSVPSSARPG
jgi:probable F420-dependent oxidoreductase